MFTCLFPPVQPEEVYAATTVRLPGTQGVFAVGLSQAVGLAERYADPGRSDRAGDDSSLHYFSKGVRPVARLAPGQATAGRDGRRRYEAQVNEASGEARGNRRDRFRELAREHLLRQTEEANHWKQRSKVATLSQGRDRLRLRESCHSGDRTWAWTDAGRQALQARVKAGGRYGEDRHALGRCRLRWRTIACSCSRGAWHEDGDSAQAWPSDQQAPQRQMAETYGNPLRQEKVRPAVASRNCQQHDQTAARIIASREKGPNAEPRDDSQSDYTQRDDTPEEGFLQSKPKTIAFAASVEPQAVVANDPRDGALLEVVPTPRRLHHLTQDPPNGPEVLRRHPGHFSRLPQQVQRAPVA